jgi:hypothetical protein
MSLLYKKRIISLTVLFLTLYPILPAHAATEGDKVTKRYRNSVVYITTEPQHPKGNGFGFVVGENKIGSKLYVVTASHVVKEDGPPSDDDSKDSKISLTFCEERHKKEAKLLNNNIDLDIALLEVSKPRGYQWKRGYYCSNYEKGDNVWFIGKQGKCEIPPDNQAGEIVKENLAGFLEVSIPSVKPGTSGAPLIHENGIIGMILQHEQKIATVLPIKRIQLYASAKESNVAWGLWKCPHLPSSHLCKKLNTNILTVNHEKGGLEWLDYVEYVDWETATERVKEANQCMAGEHNDWRLPNTSNLRTLAKSRRTKKKLKSFTGKNWFWTEDQVSCISSCYYNVVNMNGGKHDGRKIENRSYVGLVRDK